MSTIVTQQLTAGGGGLRSATANSTQIIYYLDDEEFPYSVRAPISPGSITLRDFKTLIQLPKTSYKFFFKSSDDEIGTVKEELFDDESKLPIFKGRVVAWVVTSDGSNLSVGSSSQVTEISRGCHGYQREKNAPRGYPHHMAHHQAYGGNYTECDSYDNSTTDCTESESFVSSRCDRYPRRYRSHRHRCHTYETGSESTSCVDSYDDDDSDCEDTDDVDADESASQIESASTTTVDTSASRVRNLQRRRDRMPVMMSNESSVSSSMTGSTISSPLFAVTLNIDSPKALADFRLIEEKGKLFIANFHPASALARDGRIEPGDQLVAVNDFDLGNISCEQAVEVLRQATRNQEPVKLILRKGWDSNPKGYFTIQKSEPVRPIDPGAWVAHTEAVIAMGEHPMRPPSVTTLTSSSSSASGSTAESERPLTSNKDILTLDDGMQVITKAMAAPDSGLDVRDRMWLKIKIADAFLGSDLVDWLLTHVHGLMDRKNAKKYAGQLLKEQLIKHKQAINKKSFSEHCYYGFGESINYLSAMARLQLEDANDEDDDDRDEEEEEPCDRVTLMGLDNLPSNSSSSWNGRNHVQAGGNNLFIPWNNENGGVHHYN